MSQEAFDAIIIGAGQAGPAIAARCSREGLRTAIIERGHFGGTCVNVGCMPTKALVASARAMHLARRGHDFGFTTGGAVQADLARIKARKDGIVEAARSGVETWMRGLNRTETIVGEARFTAPRTVQVNGRELTAPRIFLNLGGRALVPDLPGIRDVPTLDNRTVMELTQVPEHLIIIGGSYIGLEFAHLMRRFGSQVTVVEKSPRLLPREDEDVADGVRAILETEGVRLETGAECLSLSGLGGKRIAVGAACAGDRPPVEGTHVLLAVGRQPNTDGIGLEVAGVQTDARGFIVVDEQCRSVSAEGIWAVGDCNGRGAFTHTAWHDHEIVVGNLFDRDTRRISDRIACYALFVDPPLARIGMSEAEVRASHLDKGRPVLRAKMPMQRVGRAREAGETLGFMKVLVDAETGLLLGAAMLGMNADEVIHGLLDMMAAAQPVQHIARTVHIHPTVSELIPTLLQQLKPMN
jgi:pyruvate/2-oxoglutarate dehydrogenase complex dihydrolipoamide dehydrogenase (E3) component